MAKVTWSILCEKAVVDSFSKTLSLHSIIEKIDVSPETDKNLEKDKDAPVIPIRFCLVTLFLRSIKDKPEKPHVRLTVKLPNGKKKINPEEIVDLESSGQSRLIMNFLGITYSGEGEYLFYIEQKQIDKSNKIRWKKLSETSLVIALNSTLDT